MQEDENILILLEALADRLGVIVRDEPINIDEVSCSGGLCFVEGKYILILNSQTTVREKIQVAVKALRQFDLSDVYVKPIIRTLLEEQGTLEINESTCNNPRPK